MFACKKCATVQQILSFAKPIGRSASNLQEQQKHDCGQLGLMELRTGVHPFFFHKDPTYSWESHVLTSSEEMVGH